MSSVVLETWTQVKTTKKKSSKKARAAAATASGARKSKSNMQNRSFPRARFDFGEPGDKSQDVVHSQVSMQDTQKQPKRQVSWSSVVTTGKAPSQEKDKQYITYMYEREVDTLVRTMKWGDFEVMMDDVVVIPDDQPKPESPCSTTNM